MAKKNPTKKPRAKSAKKKGAPQVVKTTRTLPPPGAPGEILYSDGFNWVTLAPASGNDQILRSGSGGIPYWANQ